MAVHREETSTGLELSRLDGGTACVTWEELENLSASLDGPLLSTGDEGWDEAVLVWNAMAARVPALVVQPTSPADVAATIGFARERELLLSVKGGGHHIAGLSVAEGGLTLDMSQMRDVEVDPDARLARVGPGARLQDVDRATQEHRLATVLGFISEVGVAGLTLGGGLGYLTRRFGWAVDNLEEVEIVTADGRIRIANRDQHADLFWAVRGGGGNFGVVTRFTFRLHDVGPVVYGGLIAWPFDRANEVLDTYRTITTGAPRELSVWMVMLHAPPLPFVPEEFHGKKTCAMVVCYSGELADVDAVLAPIRALDNPVVEQLQPWPYTQQQSFLDDSEPKGADNYWRTEYVSELSDDLLAAARDVFAECEIPEAQVGFLHLGGAVNERSDDDGAVGNRDAQYVCGVNGRWEHGEPRADAFQRWVRNGSARVRPFTLGRTYVNFQSADEGDERTRASYGKNYDRLARIKAKYDPSNLFRLNRNIQPRDQEAVSS